MTHVIFRRRKLGRTSAKEIAKHIPGTVVIRNDQTIPFSPPLIPSPAAVSYLFRWGCTSNIPEGFTVVNTAEAIHQVNDKTAFRRLLNEQELCPKTWFDSHNTDLLGFIEHEGSVVVRPHRHAQGRNLHHCHTLEEMRAAARRCGEGYYISQYVPKVAEYRVAVVQGRAVWVARKTPANPEAIAWNVARGGRFDNVNWGDWPLKVVKTAIEAFNLSLLDFGGVDVMVDAEGNCYVLEINSAPSLTSPYRQECMGKAFSYIVQEGKARIPLVTAKGGYKKFIHPALTEDAILVEG